MAAKAPIIVIKKKGGHGGHHGGAWKVAYADFVTAMMALFIVLWLLNSSKKIQDAVGGYFRDPLGTAEKAGKDIVGIRRRLDRSRTTIWSSLSNSWKRPSAAFRISTSSKATSR